jgi:peptidoglycan hydrolase CwlO-like protein
MTVGEGIAIASLMLTVLISLVTLAVKVGRYAEQVKDLTEQNEKYDKKFDELYADRNRHENKLTEISTILMNITDKLNNMDAKIDKLAEAVNESHQTK